MPSRAFGSRGPSIPHLARTGELADLRKDVEAAFLSAEREAEGVRTVTESGPLLKTDRVVLVFSPVSPVVLVAPDPALGYEPILIKKIDTGTQLISVTGFADENVEGAPGPYPLVQSDTDARRAWTLLPGGTVHWVA